MFTNIRKKKLENLFIRKETIKDVFGLLTKCITLDLNSRNDKTAILTQATKLEVQVVDITFQLLF